MSLAWRILLFALVLNVLTLGSVQVFVHFTQDRWFQEEREKSINSVINATSELNRTYSAEALSDATEDAKQVRALISNQAIRDQCDDVILTSGRPPHEDVYLNPRGAVHRDPDTFPRQQIRDAMVKAHDVPGPVPVGAGICFALRQGEDVVGYVWFQPKHPAALPTALPIWSSALALFVGAAVFGLLLFVAVRRTIGSPLEQLHDAATAVAGGSYAARLPEHAVVGEFGPVMSAFNRMAGEVESHTTTLEQKVREAVDEAKQKERALVLSSRLASIGTLAAGVAHEVNNPIGGMQNAVNRLLESDALDERQRRYLGLVQDGLGRIARTTRRLLDFSPRASEASTFSAEEPIRRALALVEHRISRSGVSLDLALAGGLPLLRGDSHELQQVLLNLLLNSLDAFEQQGERDGPGSICVRTERAGEEVRIVVEDDGPGMAPADLGRVFDPFFTKKDRPDASGLGLFICYSIVQSHGGALTVDSELGQGFRVNIVLPAKPS